MKSKVVDWMNKESDAWVSEGIITQEQCQQIQKRYVADGGNPLMVMFAIIGSLLIGAGIVLVFATNWWNLPMEVRLSMAFLPLLLAQGICLYTLKKNYYSVSFREGSSVFLSLSFFATVALVGQVFHTPSHLSTYLLICMLFTLPIVYLFRSKAAMTICLIGSWCIWEFFLDWELFFFLVLCFPYFYVEITRHSGEKGVNYLLLLLSFLICRFPTLNMVSLDFIECFLITSIVLFLVDLWFRKYSEGYFFTMAKVGAIFLVTVTMMAMSLHSFGLSIISEKVGMVGIVLISVYLSTKVKWRRSFIAFDIFLLVAILLVAGANFGEWTARIVTMGLGVFYVIRGSKDLVQSKLNYGMVLVMYVVFIYFFDSSLDLLGRGVLFVLLGCTFLGLNLYISHKRRAVSS